MKFTKMQGAGNDYVYVNCFAETVSAPEKAAPILSDRHFGIGGDGLILLSPSDTADFRMDIYNADGSRAEMCGNGIRCAARLAYDSGICRREEMRVETLAGEKIVHLEIADGAVRAVTVNMGRPDFLPAHIPVRAAGERFLEQKVSAGEIDFTVSAVSMGNPHAVIFVEDTEAFPVERFGPLLERAEVFPARANIEFAEVLNESTIRMRVWERGSGETLACGTGSCATLVIAATLGKTGREADLLLRGGTLHIRWDEASGNVFMTGPAEYAFTGEVRMGIY